MILDKKTLAKLLTSKTLSLTNDTVKVSLMGSSWDKQSLAGALVSGDLQNKKLNNLVFSADTLVFSNVSGSFKYLVVSIGSDIIGYKDIGSATADAQDITIDNTGLISFAIG